MKITAEQEKILDQFKCERLSSNEENKELIKNFVNIRGSGLVDYLKEDAWEEDSEGITACYLIKAPNGKPCFFFALKCGALFEPLDEEALRKEYREIEKFLKLLQDSSEKNPDREEILKGLEQIRIKRNTTLEDVKNLIMGNAQRKKRRHKRLLDLLETDKRREGSRPIQRVGSTFPGIELTHFCSDDNEKKIWDTYGFRFTMGEVFFWKYIAPIFIDIQKYVGCQFAFLFAADKTPDGTLTNYYNVSLKFSKLTNVGTNKPVYDFCCEFMSQEVKNLKEQRERFFENFNIDNDDEIV